MTAEPLVRVTDLRKTFGLVRILDGVTLDLEAGQALAVLGPNGAGKTTLLRILGTLLRPAGGTARVAGFDCAREAARVRAEVGFVGHAAWVYDDLTARENLRFWTTLAGRPAGDGGLRRALGAVELDRVADERVRTFSAGMKRRLTLARLLLLEPRVLLLDEPFSGLDQQGRKWLEEHLHGVKARGGAILMATHSLGRGLGVADRVAILAGGRIVLDTPRAGLAPEALPRLYALHVEEGP